MADIWQQFHSLPKAIRDGVASSKALSTIEELEAQHQGLDLAYVVMRAVVHEFPVKELAQHLEQENGLPANQAQAIADRLTKEVFTGLVADYLGLTASTPPVSPAKVPPPVTAVPKPVEQAVPVATSPVRPNTPEPAKAPAPTPMPPRPVAVSIPVVPTTPTPQPETPKIPSVPAPTAPMSQPATPVGPQSPTTQYSDEDAAEIEAQRTKLKTLANPISPVQDFDSLAHSILIQQNLSYSDVLLDRRAVAIIKSRLKGSRTTEQTVEVLRRDPKIGGLGLDPEIAETVARLADVAAEQLKSRGMVATPAPAEMIPVPPVPHVVQERPAAKPPLRRDAPTGPSPVLPNVTEAPRPSRPIVRPADIPAPPPLTTSSPKPAVSPIPRSVVQGVRQQDRPTVADVVRPTVKTLGPADEMRSMTLIEFRRLGQGAKESAQRLLDKFQHLQRESYAVWSDALHGWRESDVYRLYVTMGRESLEKGVPMTQVVADRAKQNLPYLSEHEFTTIADLNRQLQV